MRCFGPVMLLPLALSVTLFAAAPVPSDVPVEVPPALLAGKRAAGLGVVGFGVTAGLHFVATLTLGVLGADLPRASCSGGSGLGVGGGCFNPDLRGPLAGHPAVVPGIVAAGASAGICTIATLVLAWVWLNLRDEVHAFENGRIVF